MVEIDPEVVAHALLEAAGATDQVERRRHVGQLVEETAESAAQSEHRPLGQRLRSPRQAVVFKQVTEGPRSAVPRRPMREILHERGTLPTRF